MELFKPNIEKLVEKRDFDKLSMLLKRHKDGAIRSNAAFALGKIGDGRAADALIGALKDEPLHPVRADVARVLGELGDGRAVDALIEALMDQSEYVRRAAVHALAEIGDARAVEGLRYALRDRDDEVRKFAVHTLAEIGDAGAVEGIIYVLKHSEDEVRRIAAEALGELGDARAVMPLIDLANTKGIPGWVTYESAYMTAQRALVKIGPPAVDPLIKALKSSNETVCEFAAEVLGIMHETRAVRPLIAAFKSRVSWTRRRAAAVALGVIGDAQAVEPLIDALSDVDNPPLTDTIAKALGMIGDARAAKPLVTILGNIDSQRSSLLYETVKNALVKIGQPAIKPLFAATLEYFWTDSYIKIVSEIDNKRAVDFCVATLKHKDARLRDAAAATLREINKARV